MGTMLPLPGNFQGISPQPTEVTSFWLPPLPSTTQCLLGRSLPLATCPKTPAQAVWGNVPCQTPGLGTSLRKPPKMEEGQACHPSGQGKGAQVTTWPGWGCWS